MAQWVAVVRPGSCREGEAQQPPHLLQKSSSGLVGSWGHFVLGEADVASPPAPATPVLRHTLVPWLSAQDSSAPVSGAFPLRCQSHIGTLSHEPRELSMRQTDSMERSPCLPQPSQTDYQPRPVCLGSAEAVNTRSGTM